MRLAARPRWRASFNPHPPLLAGETSMTERYTLAQLVSIHTRHYWRVKRAAGRVRTGELGFNPHPPLLAGETPRCARQRATWSSFNPHPPLLAGET